MFHQPEDIMDVQQQQRGRSPSAGNKNRNLNPSHSPHPQYRDNVSTLGLDPVSTNAGFSTGLFSASNPVSSTSENFNFGTAYLPGSAPENHLPHASAPPEQAFNRSQEYSHSFSASFINQLEHSSNIKSAQNGDSYPGLVNSNQPNLDDYPIYTNNNPVSDFGSSLLLDAKLEQSPSLVQQSINPADLSRMSSPHNNPTPPHLVPPGAQSPGRPASPASSPGTTYYTPQHSRHASLDPSSAAYMPNQPQSDWQGAFGSPSFRHRRAASEHSDVSSAAHSPYMSHHETFDASDNQSPLLAAQADPNVYENALGIETFTISDQGQQQGLSPARSPYISPQLVPQQPVVDLVPENHFLLQQQSSNQLASAQSDIYVSQAEAPLPVFHQHKGLPDMGQAAQMATPAINVEFAPPSRNSSFGPPKLDADTDSLSPPMNRARGRSKSDPFGNPMSRSMSPSSVAATLGSIQSASPRSLSPFDGTLSTPASREASPANKNRRQSTSSIDNRNYILDLADPQRPGATTADSKRAQKHPATFQCSLCPKRFTRAYNLRSHLRTHTDERPFVCTVCGKAFARQHDRKRHEGLHSGEKKFVCRGDLARGGQWGCGRRFARADALGRHFRSEAGRVCIKPLLDEEALERERAHLGQQLSGPMQPVQQAMAVPGMDSHATNFPLPAALLAQYPALQTVQWDQMAAQADDGSDIGGGGRSSFDASSGGEFEFDEDDGYRSGPGPNYGPGPHEHPVGVSSGGDGWAQPGHQWASDYEGAR